MDKALDGKFIYLVASIKQQLLESCLKINQ